MAKSRKKPKAGKYTDEFRTQALRALAANRGDLNETARQLQNISVSTLQRWRDNNRNTSPSATNESTSLSATNERQRQDMVADLEAIAWLLVRAMPEKITDAPLNQLTSALKSARETIQSIRNEQLTREAFPLDLSKMTNEHLELLERATTLVLGHLQGRSVPEHSGPDVEDDEDSDGVASPGVEPAALASPFSPKEESS